ARLFFQAPPQDAQQIQAALPGGGGGLARWLPADAPLKLRLGLVPARAVEQIRRIPELSELVAQLGEVPGQVASALLPGAAASARISSPRDRRSRRYSTRTRARLCSSTWASWPRECARCPRAPMAPDRRRTLRDRWSARWSNRSPRCASPLRPCRAPKA